MEEMLTKDLIEVRRMRGRIYPRFAKGSEMAELAERVIEVFKEHLGMRYGDALEHLKSLENASNYRKVRGFAKVLERFCRFEISTSVDPRELRMFLFSKGFVTSDEERRRILREAAEKFQTSVDEIENAMFADMDEEMIISHVDDINAADLMKFYNLSLVQSVLFDALRMNFWTDSNYKEIFRRIKWLGLMYDLYDVEGEDEERIRKLRGFTRASERNEGVRGDDLIVEITGAASILKMTRKYGTAMAKLLPTVMKANAWWLRAEILDENTKRIYLMEIDSSRSFLFPNYEESISYDSSLEEEFARNIRALNEAYEVVREPAVVKAGRHAFIPDFSVRVRSSSVHSARNAQSARSARSSSNDSMNESKCSESGSIGDRDDSGDSVCGGDGGSDGGSGGGKKREKEKRREVYIEIVGFWTPEYLRSKIEKVRSANIPLIIIARSEYGTRFDEISDDVVIFSSKIPYNEVARKIERKLKAETNVVLEGEVVNMRSIADVNLISIQDVVKEARAQGYEVIGYYAVRKRTVERVKAEIDALSEPKHFRDVAAVLRKYQMTPDVLPELGYKIRWAGLNFEDAVVEKCSDVHASHTTAEYPLSRSAERRNARKKRKRKQAHATTWQWYVNEDSSQ